LVLEEDENRTPSSHHLFSLILDTDKALARNEKGQNSHSGNLSSLVARKVLNSNQLFADLKEIGDF